jgi:general secretion pathway protein I
MIGTRERMRLNSGEPDRPKAQSFSAAEGFTLLEVLIALAILAIAATVTLSLISGSLSNIRKVQQRTRAIEHAESIMESALIDPSTLQPTSNSGSFQDGTNWIMRVEEYTALDKQTQTSSTATSVSLPKLLSYTVETIGPGSIKPDCRLQTLKLVKVQTTSQPARIP